MTEFQVKHHGVLFVGFREIYSPIIEKKDSNITDI